jgi:hypothetical protein
MGKEAATTDRATNKHESGRGDAKDTPNNTAARGQTGGQAGGQAGGQTGTEEIEVVRGLVSGLDQDIPSPSGCTCGKKEGERGPHKKTCPMSVKSNKGKKSASSKPSTGKKNHDTVQTVYMVQTLLTVVFNISAMRLGEHWKLSNEESKNLAEPIAAILDRHDLTEKTGAYGDYIALVAAIGMIIVPKVMIQLELSKQKKGGQTNVRDIQSKQDTGSTKGNDTDAGAPEPSDRAVQQRDTHYRPSDVKRSLAIYG